MKNRDIVYFCKRALYNPELTYSIRSVVENFPNHRIVIVGDKPKCIKPDLFIHIEQYKPSKWENVNHNLSVAINHEEITDEFYLFNDDFFIMKPIKDFTFNYYDGTIIDRLNELKERYPKGGDYSTLLANSFLQLTINELPYYNYAVHVPMFIKKASMIEVFNIFPNMPLKRALYGNYTHSKRDKRIKDNKVYNNVYEPNNEPFLSTTDESFTSGEVGKYIRNKFPNPSRYEV